MRTKRSFDWRPPHALCIALLCGALVACHGDCVVYPCPLPIAATITVSAASAPAGILGLTMAVNGADAQSGFCSDGPSSTCRIVGGRGSYHVELRAPGFVPVELNLTITGADAGCNTCGHVDAQTVSVIMRPPG